jgi:hypothetical protein
VHCQGHPAAGVVTGQCWTTTTRAACFPWQHEQQTLERHAFQYHPATQRKFISAPFTPTPTSHTHASRAHGGKTRRGISCTGLLLQASSPTSRGGMSSPLQVGCCYHVQYRPPKRGPGGIRSAPQPVQHYAECLAQTQEDHVLLVLQQHGRCQNSAHTDPNQCHPRNPTAEAQLLTSPVFDHPYQAQVSISSISKLHPLHKRWLPYQQCRQALQRRAHAACGGRPGQTFFLSIAQ